MKNTKILAISVYGKEARNVYFLSKIPILGKVFKKKATEAANDLADQGIDSVQNYLSGNDIPTLPALPDKFEKLDKRQKNYFEKFANLVTRSVVKLPTDVARTSLDLTQKAARTPISLLTSLIKIPPRFIRGTVGDIFYHAASLVKKSWVNIIQKPFLPIALETRALVVDGIKRLFSESQGLGKDFSDLSSHTMNHTYGLLRAIGGVSVDVAVGGLITCDDALKTTGNIASDVSTRVSDVMLDAQDVVDETSKNMIDTANAVGDLMGNLSRVFESQQTIDKNNVIKLSERQKRRDFNQHKRNQTRSSLNLPRADQSQSEAA